MLGALGKCTLCTIGRTGPESDPIWMPNVTSLVPSVPVSEYSCSFDIVREYSFTFDIVIYYICSFDDESYYIKHWYFKLKMPSFRLLVVFQLFSPYFCSVRTENNSLLTNTTSGPVRGGLRVEGHNSIATFLGIPYAKPPTGMTICLCYKQSFQSAGNC